MKKAICLSVALLTFGLVGCGGSGGSNFSNLAGNYSGTYQILQGSSEESAGQLNVSIDTAGNVTGTMQRTDKNPETVSLRNGFIQSDGRTLRYTFKYADTSDRIVTGTIEKVGSTLEPTNNNGVKELNVEITGGGTLKMRFLLNKTS